MVRKVVAGILILICILLLLASYGALRNLRASYQDSPDSTYITFGGIEILFAAVFGITGVYLWRSPR